MKFADSRIQPNSACFSPLGKIFGIDTRSLAVFRMGLAIEAMVDLFLRLRDLRVFYTDSGVLPRSLVTDQTWQVSAYLMNGSALFVSFLFGLTFLTALSLLVGYRTKTASFLLWFLTLSLQSRNYLILEAGDKLYRLLLFWALFLPLGTSWSIDNKLRGGQEKHRQLFSAGTLALCVQIISVYWFSVLWKRRGDWATEGTALWRALNMEQFTTAFGQWLLVLPHSALKLLTHATFYFEILGPLLLLCPFFKGRIRLLGVFCFVMFDAFLASIIELGTFPLVNLVSYTVFLPPKFWDLVSQRFKPPRFLAWRPKWLSPAREPFTDIILFRMPKSLIGNVLASFFLVYILSWNIGPFKPRLGVPAPYRGLGYVLSLDQVWGMYAPMPPDTYGWCIAAGYLGNGREVDVLRKGEPVQWEKPRLISALCPNSYWRLYLYRLSIMRDPRHLQHFANYLMKQWNSTHLPSDKLEKIEIYFMQMRISMEEQTSGHKKELLWRSVYSESPDPPKRPYQETMRPDHSNHEQLW